jgi:hypothetical protein
MMVVIYGVVAVPGEFPLSWDYLLTYGINTRLNEEDGQTQIHKILLFHLQNILFSGHFPKK